MKGIALSALFREQPARDPRSGGFTLLEIIIAVTMLAVFLLPMMLIVSEAKIRAIRYTHQREVRDLAQRKLFDRIHYYEEANRGDFTLEGHPEWTWEVNPPEMIGSSEQVLLQYTIRVAVPQKLEGQSPGEGTPGEEGSTYKMSLWSFPDALWYTEQQDIYDRGGYSPLYGSSSMQSPLGAGDGTMTGGSY